MPGPLPSSNHTEKRVPGGRRFVDIPFYGTTAANGDLTLQFNYDGTLTQTRSTNQYTFVVGPFKRVIKAVAVSGTSTAFVGTMGASDGTAGTIRMDFAAALNATQMHGEFTVEV